MYEFDCKARQLTGRFFNELLLQKKLAKEQFSLGWVLTVQVLGVLLYNMPCIDEPF